MNNYAGKVQKSRLKKQFTPFLNQKMKKKTCEQCIKAVCNAYLNLVLRKKCVKESLIVIGTVARRLFRLPVNVRKQEFFRALVVYQVFTLLSLYVKDLFVSKSDRL